MSSEETRGDPLGESLERYVTAPLVDAQSLVRQELEEVRAEKQALHRFNERVADMAVVTPRPPRVKVPVADPLGSPKVEDLREAYRETVMAVPHYSDTYGESLEAHVAAELGEEVVPGFRSGQQSLTGLYKTRLLDTVNQSIAGRRVFCEHLEGELDSLVANHEKLNDLLGPLDGPKIPAGYGTDFEEGLTEIEQDRQQTVQTRKRIEHVDCHPLCSYLYEDVAWTYPVLSSVTRTRRAVEQRGSDRPGSSVDASTHTDYTGRRNY